MDNDSLKVNDEKSLRVKRKKSQRRWRYVMEVPGHGADSWKMWEFVAAHVEDDSRKSTCLLAVKAWRRIYKAKKVPYRERNGEEMFPLEMPLFDQMNIRMVGKKW